MVAVESANGICELVSYGTTFIEAYPARADETAVGYENAGVEVVGAGWPAE